MILNKNKKLVLFGAGKIGRSFIGQLFSRGGYEVVFIDIDQQIIEELNRRKTYNVVIKSEKEELIPIRNVRGVLSTDERKVIDEIATASIMAISVGSNVMAKIAQIVAKGLLKRYESDKDNALDIILAENLRDAAPYFRENLIPFLPENYPFDEMVGLIETSIGKMVPIMLKKDMDEDILQVFAEPYNTLILDRLAFKNPIPDIEGLAPKENMKAWVDRKLFIHNLGHAATAYIGHVYNPGYIYIYEPLAVPEVYHVVRKTMLCAANILIKKYPDEFTQASLTEHIDDLLSRFQSISLGDTIYRVGCDLTRKLGTDDRIVGVIKTAMQLEMNYNDILFPLVCGFNFKAKDESGNGFPGDAEFIMNLEIGIENILKKVCEFNPAQIRQIYQEINEIQVEIGNRNLSNFFDLKLEIQD